MRYLGICLVSLLLILCNTLAHAESINLLQVKDKAISVYESPTIKSKATTLVPSQVLILFFQQNDWVKIANPNNGEVGWISRNELASNTFTIATVNIPKPNQYVVTQAIKDKSGNTNVYSVMQYSTGSEANQQQAEHLLKQIQIQQQQMEERFNKMFAQPMVIKRHSAVNAQEENLNKPK